MLLEKEVHKNDFRNFWKNLETKLFVKAFFLKNFGKRYYRNNSLQAKLNEI